MRSSRSIIIPLRAAGPAALEHFQPDCALTVQAEKLCPIV
jgi:hypothetical protein